MVQAYYNEFDAGAAAWLGELIGASLLPAGRVDARDIRDIRAEEVGHYEQAHFFTGIGGWPYALHLAGWPATRSVWTGSCPCQPFSTAGKRKGEEDERHLWPAWFALIRECRPDCLFGEQVSGSAGLRWLDGVRTDLESEGYAFGAADLPAACVGAPHIRQRLFWVASLASDAERQRSQEHKWEQGAREEPHPADGLTPRHSPHAGRPRIRHQRHALSGETRGDQGEEDQRQRLRSDAGDGIGAGLSPDAGQQPSRDAVAGCSAEESAATPTREGEAISQPGRHSISGYWDAFDLIHYRDGKTRRVEPGTFPLAHGVPARLVKLRGYGNAIVPQVAAAFVRAFMEAR